MAGTLDIQSWPLPPSYSAPAGPPQNETEVTRKSKKAHRNKLRSLQHKAAGLCTSCQAHAATRPHSVFEALTKPGRAKEAHLPST